MARARLTMLCLFLLGPGRFLGAQDALERLTGVPVLTEPGPQQPISDSPAITTILTSEELRRAGITTLAQALRRIAGFYGIEDSVGENVGIRGIQAGARSYSRVLKVMVDGQPVAFRPDATVFLGPELIPIEAVDHIEVSRGPASAMHGADAFLGAVQVVTKAYARRARSSVVLRGGTAISGGRTLGSEVLMEAGGERWALMAAGSSWKVDRSGLSLPEESPVLRTTANVERVSQGDIARPASFFVKGERLWGEVGRTEVTALVGRQSSGAEWADFAPLSHVNRILMHNGFLRVKTDLDLGKGWSFSFHAAHAEGEPEAGERIGSTAPGLRVRRDIGYRSLDLGARVKAAFRSQDALVLGVDHATDDQRLMGVFQEDLVTGQSQRIGVDQGHRQFTNLGVYLQGHFQASDDLDADLNLRQDRQNVYGSSFSHRASLVYRFTDTTYGKLLHATSFKAPTPYQLYAQPLYYAELTGNPDLKPERARTTEAELGWDPGNRMLARINLFENVVEGMIVLVPLGTVRPTNLGRQHTQGVEAEFRGGTARHMLAANLALQRTREQIDWPFAGTRETSGSAMPQRTLWVQWQGRFRDQWTTTVEAFGAGPRRASLSNTNMNYRQPYTLPGYLTFHAALHLTRVRWSFTLRGEDLLNRRWAEPGARGFDLPTPGRSLLLSLAWRH